MSLSVITPTGVLLLSQTGTIPISNQIINEGEKVALLLLKSLDNSNLLNEIIYDEDLSKWAFNEHGKVVRK